MSIVIGRFDPAQPLLLWLPVDFFPVVWTHPPLILSHTLNPT
jgi:hypothetical protein